jgi:ABC-type nitrate/sulfonate/bicarbonate transport system permease component
MRNLVSIALAFVFVHGVVASDARADDTFDLTVTPDSAPAYELTYEEYRIEELQRTAKRSRNALIGTSAAAVVGLALVLPAASSQCQSVEVGGKSEYECTRAGDTLLRVGSPLVIGGLTGAVVSGIILGVRKGKIRRLNDSFQRKTRALRWDERTSRFVF